jgi:hypothetical protein
MGIIFSPLIIAQELSAALSLRLGPGIGFPTNIELPTGTTVSVNQRRNNWLLVVDDREKGGWAKISDVELSGGLADRQAWRLSELKKKDIGDIQGRWFSNKQGYGLSLGWKLRTNKGHWLAEIERSSDSQSKSQAFSTWYAFDYELTTRSYYSAGLGLGYAHENSYSRIFNNEFKSSNTFFGGIEFALGFLPIKQIDTGLSVRYLLAESPNNAYSTVISWYWSFGI